MHISNVFIIYYYISVMYLLSFYSMSCIRIVAHIVNCGYARVSISENSSPLAKGQYARDID